MRQLVERLLSTIPVLLGVTLLAFLVVRAIPGDPAKVMAGERANDALLAERIAGEGRGLRRRGIFEPRLGLHGNSGGGSFGIKHRRSRQVIARAKRLRGHPEILFPLAIGIVGQYADPTLIEGDVWAPLPFGRRRRG